MKTKIIYISGSEIFNINDIHAAFEEVREALQLGPDTVLFGVPVDKEDAGFGTITTKTKSDTVQETTIEPEITEKPVEIIESVENVVEEMPVEPEPKPKRSRARKTTKTEEIKTTEPENQQDTDDDSVEKIVPILSVLSGDEPAIETAPEQSETDEVVENVSDEHEIVVTETEETEDIITEIDEHPETENEGEPDLEKLLSAMTPLQEDVLEENITPDDSDESDSDNDVDATLEQLATEFAETQDKIATETKSSGRSKIGKLRNILPFKQSKHKDQGLGDLFGWAGVAANDEDFSVPGFFTNASSKK